MRINLFTLPCYREPDVECAIGVGHKLLWKSLVSDQVVRILLPGTPHKLIPTPKSTFIPYL